jgi:hypothetical protein
VVKRQDDGSREVWRAIRRFGYDERRVRVCGVNTGYCVRETVIGLLRKCAVIVEVDKRACGNYNSEINEWNGFPKHSQLIYL